ncbi:DNA (cytosine-5-)-methyltransferase [Lederbergia citrisecunda]|uniref:DNA (cytosine-5-)-methyltransferase n=1 Tax=Lederbergia citrisecunda TaxID=2833583 RepID=UPI003D284C4E
MRYIDLFAGIGGFRYALDSVGFDCVFTSEIDNIPAEMYKLLHGDEEISGDIMKIEARDIPNHDLLVGGFPCQGFSTNGTRLGFKYKTGNLFFEAARIANEKKPKYILMENVTGLLNHDKGKTISIMMDTLSEIGYGVDFTVLTSSDFGLPQQRRRVFIIGALGTEAEKWETVKNQQVNKAKEKVLESYPDTRTINFPFPVGNLKTSSLSSIIDKNAEKNYLEFGDFLIKLGENSFRIKDGTTQGYTDFEAAPYETTIDYTFMTSKTRRGRVKHGVTKTLDQSVDIAVYDGEGFRRITPREVFRLQGFSDKVHETLKNNGFSERQLYARPSRSVSLPIVKAIGEAIKQYDKRI